jgi:RNA polymerase sigma factor (sigma-70 family)
MPDFSTTRWTLVRRAADASPQGRRALGELLALYQPALRAQLARWRVPGAEGEDLWQEFATRMMEGEWLRRAQPSAGSFRAFLGTALKRFAANRLREATALKRGGDATFAAESEIENLATDTVGPDRQFDADWASLVLARVQEALREDARSRGREALYEALEPFLVEEAQRDDYHAIAARFGSNANAIGVAVYRLRARLRELLRREVAETVEDAAALEREMDSLRDALRG